MNDSTQNVARRIAPPMPSKGRGVGGYRVAMPPNRAFESNLGTRGGGGPENAGARPAQRERVNLMTAAPSWQWESQFEYMGKAAPSTSPVTAGIKANDFRGLGELGGRQ